MGESHQCSKYKKGTNYYELRCDTDHCSPEEMQKFATKAIGSNAVKEQLKRAFGLAYREGYCFGGIKRRKKKKMTATEATPLAHPETILTPGIMHKRSISSHTSSMQSLGRCDNNFDDESMSDNWSNYEIDDTAFYDRETNDGVDAKSDGEKDMNVMGP
eukprot:4431770-Ditylum_brightwellii.AAC.1